MSIRDRTKELSRRERQIMDVLHRRGRAIVAELAAAIPDPPTTGAMRTMLRILERKGMVKRSLDGTRLVYSPVESRALAQSSSLRHLVSTFFDGSAGHVMSQLIDSVSPGELDDADIDRLETLLHRARAQRRKGS